MSRDRRLSSVVHGLLHMAAADSPVTSEGLSVAMNSHPVAVRRELGRLRDRGLVRSVKGHGGGWTLAVSLGDLTLRDVYEGLGAPSLFAVQNKSDRPRCLIEQSVNDALDASFDEAQALLLARMEGIRLVALEKDFRRRLRALGLPATPTTPTTPTAPGARGTVCVDA